MQTTDADIAIIHDNEWCSTDDPTITQTINQYAETFFRQEPLSTVTDPEPCNTTSATIKGGHIGGGSFHNQTPLSNKDKDETLARVQIREPRQNPMQHHARRNPPYRMQQLASGYTDIGRDRHFTSHRALHNINVSSVQNAFSRNSDGNACPFVTDYTYSTYPVNIGVSQAPPWPGT
jgi:hypothetical protein